MTSYYRPFAPISPRHREEINIDTEAKYNTWLASVKDGDQVLLQQFHPKKDGCLDISMEYWHFRQVKVWRDQLCSRGTNDHPFNRQTGKCCYWNSPKDWGEVFPARIVPIHYEFAAHAVKENGDSFISDLPLYEPNYIQSNRHVLKLDTRDFGKPHYEIGKVYPCNYLQKVDDNYLLHVFTADEWTMAVDGAIYLYSEYLRD